MSPAGTPGMTNRPFASAMAPRRVPAIATLEPPAIQGGIFADVGKALLHSDSNRALLGSYGISFRLALGPLAVLRLDVGGRFSDRKYQGYSLSADQRTPGFVHFFFGYNY